METVILTLSLWGECHFVQAESHTYCVEPSGGEKEMQPFPSSYVAAHAARSHIVRRSGVKGYSR